MSPTVHEEQGFRFVIYYNDHPPAHIHVIKGGLSCKIGLDPVEVIENKGMKASDTRKALKIAARIQAHLQNEWDKIHVPDLERARIMKVLYSLPAKKMGPDYPVNMRVDDQMLWVTLYDGRVIGTPLTWYPWLQDMTLAELMDCELSTSGVHWPKYDVDLGIEGMLKGINPAEKWHDALEPAKTG